MTVWVLGLVGLLLFATVARPAEVLMEMPTEFPTEKPTPTPRPTFSPNVQRKQLLQFRDDLSQQGCDVHWGSKKNPCDWTGVGCPDGDGIITQISINNIRCRTEGATIPSSIGKLTVLPDLTYLTISNNSFQGDIPNELGRLTNLVSLKVTWNSLDGTLPSFIGNFESLSTLDLSCNHLRGTIPNTIGNIQHINFLYLQQNSFTGKIPSSLFTIPLMSNLLALTLLGNSLVGSIPEIDVIHNAAEFVHPTIKLLSFRGNFLTGTMPSSISNIDSLVFLDVSSNRLHGTLPSSLSVMTNLEFLSLSNNDFSGQILESLAGNWSSMVFLKLSNNRFESSLPPSLGSCKELMYLLLDNNNFDKSPTFIKSLSNLISLNLSTNSFSGSIVDVIGGLTLLEYVDLSSNKLSGPFPVSLSGTLKSFIVDDNAIAGSLPASLFHGTFAHLQTLSMSSNSLSGTIPNIAGAKLSSLRFLDLSSCSFSGSIPSSIGQIYSLQDLRMGYNKFTGTMPKELCQLSQLSSLSLMRNRLKGEFHSCLGNLTTLQFIHLEYNDLQGPLYSQIGQLTGLIRLLLTGNSLTGSMPSEIGKLGSLTFFSMNGNSLVEGIPFELEGLTSIRNLDLSDNFFKYDARSGVGLSFLSKTNMPNLEYLDLGRNFFQGRMPNELFRIPALTTIVLTGNCFTGSIPVSVCQATNVVNLLLDGLSAGEIEWDLCSKPIWSKTWRSSFGFNARKTNKMLGSIPSCVYSLPKLVKLHLAGNQLSGQIDPSLSSWPANLNELVLAHNRLTQSIPSHLQQQFSRLQRVELAANKLNGTIYDLQLPHLEIDLSVNRFSGELASTTRHLNRSTIIRILEGNAFSCDGGRQTLPSTDPSFSDFHCASDITDTIIYIFTGFFIAFLIFYFLYELKEPPDLDANLLTGLKHVRIFINKSNAIIKVLAVLGAIYVFFLFPVYGASTAYYRARTFLYIWTLSGALKTGIPASYLLMFCFATVIISAFTMLMMWHSFQLSPIQEKVKQLLLFFNPPKPVPGLAKQDELAQSNQDTKEEAKRKEKEAKKKEKEYAALERGVVTAMVARLVLVFSVSIAVCMAVNVAYVRTIVTLTSTEVLFMQVCMACFKSAWTYATTKFLKSKRSYFGYEKHEVEIVVNSNMHVEALLSESFLTYVLLEILIRIVIPCGASAFADANCFKDYFYSAKPISASYGSTIEYMSTSISTGIQINLYEAFTSGDFSLKVRKLMIPYTKTVNFSKIEPVGASILLIPPFQYKYLCSSRILEMYAPVVATSVVIRILHHFWVHFARWIINIYFKPNKKNPAMSFYRYLLKTLSPLDRTRFERRTCEAHLIAKIRAKEASLPDDAAKNKEYLRQLEKAKVQLGIKEDINADTVKKLDRISAAIQNAEFETDFQAPRPDEALRWFEAYHDEMRSQQHLFSHLEYSVALIFDFSLLLTFGLVCAPIGIVLIIAIVIKVNDVKQKIRRFATKIVKKSSNEAAKYTSKLELNRLEKEVVYKLKREGTDLFRSRWLLVFVSTLFTSYFCFDAAGDSVGKAQAVGILLLHIFFVFALSFLVEVVIRAHKSQSGGAEDDPYKIRDSISSKVVGEAGNFEFAYPSVPEVGGGLEMSQLQQASSVDYRLSDRQSNSLISLSGATRSEEG